MHRSKVGRQIKDDVFIYSWPPAAFTRVRTFGKQSLVAHSLTTFGLSADKGASESQAETLVDFRLLCCSLLRRNMYQSANLIWNFSLSVIPWLCVIHIMCQHVFFSEFMLRNTKEQGSFLPLEQL